MKRKRERERDRGFESMLLSMHIKDSDVTFVLGVRLGGQILIEKFPYERAKLEIGKDVKFIGNTIW